MGEVRYTEMYEPKTFDNWKDLSTFYQDSRDKWKRWVFRGHEQSKWLLKSRLERAVQERFGLPLNEAADWEEMLLREFRRHLHRFSMRVPREQDRVEWLAFMQHHGAPTKLIDWTYSFWVGVYFAVEGASKGQECSVWALDPDCVRERAYQKLPPCARSQIDRDPDGKRPETIEAIFSSGEPSVWVVNPFHLSERLAVQQGTFVAGTDMTKPFMDNMFEIHRVDPNKKCMVKIDMTCSEDFLRQTLTELHRMNVNRATLFPGLDGFAQSLENRIAMPHFFDYLRLKRNPISDR